jgi:hypothetical protein
MHKLDDLTSAVGGSEVDGEGKDGRLTGGKGGKGSGAAGSPVVGSAASGNEISGGGQILSGIASGLGLGGSGSGSDAGSVMEPIMDLGTFVKIVTGKDGGREKKGRGMGIGSGKTEWDERGRESGKEKYVVAGSVRRLWTGRIAYIVGSRERAYGKKGEDKTGVTCDVDVEDERERERIESKSTEDESDALGGLGKPWLQKRWAG